MSEPQRHTSSRDYAGQLVVGLAVAVLTASSAPWWWPALREAVTGAQNRDTTVTVVGFTGGCDVYRVVAQNRWQPYGTAKEPRRT